MSSKRQPQRRPNGFSVVEIIVVIVGLAIIGFLVMRIMDQRSSETANTGRTSEPAPEVNDSSDLQEAEEFVNDTDIDSALDTSEIDDALNE